MFQFHVKENKSFSEKIFLLLFSFIVVSFSELYKVEFMYRNYRRNCCTFRVEVF